MNNPFSPGFGKVPPIYLGRTEDLQKILEQLENPFSPYQTTLVYGMRGTGKTAFITDLSRELQKKKNWIVVNLALGNPLLPTLVDAVYRKSDGPLQKLLAQIKGVSVSAFGFSLTAEKPDTQQYQILLEEILKRMKESGHWLMVTIDEVKSTPELRQFASVYQLMLREDLPISLIMTGLPQHVSALQNDDVLTFLLRSARIVLKPLDAWIVRNSYAKAFAGSRSVSEPVLTEMTRLTAGYAYAFQLLGYYVWENSTDQVTEDTLREVLPDYKTDLYRNAYVKIYQSLTRVEQIFVNAMADHCNKYGEVSISVIGESLHKPGNYIAPYRKKLIDTQVITATQRGYVAFTLPFFREFLIDGRELY